ncbi:hypothetical protein LPJ61_006133 [Coemansia biformis]|uniref:Uncharacterized protein n=1 Tax=Coemansia biformis TaxID=1286918 RepID=A0A9W7XTS5_9FUNG|nr:hypothetical protein LPJ61_006133 [Coemansia biformis]
MSTSRAAYVGPDGACSRVVCRVLVYLAAAVVAVVVITALALWVSRLLRKEGNDGAAGSRGEQHPAARRLVATRSRPRQVFWRRGAAQGSGARALEDPPGEERPAGSLGQVTAHPWLGTDSVLPAYTPPESPAPTHPRSSDKRQYLERRLAPQPPPEYAQLYALGEGSGSLVPEPKQDHDAK